MRSCLSRFPARLARRTTMNIHGYLGGLEGDHPFKREWAAAGRGRSLPRGCCRWLGERLPFYPVPASYHLQDQMSSRLGLAAGMDRVVRCCAMLFASAVVRRMICSLSVLSRARLSHTCFLICTSDASVCHFIFLHWGVDAWSLSHLSCTILLMDSLPSLHPHVPSCWRPLC
ncbi:hypothetical protein K466DRAFT_48515 [Polyporus arcularius HHB13444]|uniref:Uncharacterized protein n=1 Tax=Polyporus arcularius HHB13444 TaxID=1314778 RepID=A0A5C3PWM8_9APHY|nr:hypothetical protein K466DRAFT_48515 [Polyporus arcularius HHB13444]